MSKLELISRHPRIAVHRNSASSDHNPVLLAHCFSGGAWMWQENFFDYFANKNRVVYAVDYRGHGESEGRELVPNAGLSDYLADLKAAYEYVESLNSQKPIVVGHSIGSLLTRLLASERELNAFALLGFGEPAIAFPSFFKWCMTRFPWLTTKMLVTGKSSAMWGNPSPHYQAMFSHVKRSEVHRYVERLRNQNESNVIFREIQKLQTVPDALGAPSVLVLAGTNDVVAPRRSIEALASRYQHSKIQWLKDRAHDVCLSDGWETVAQLLDEWLANMNQIPSREPVGNSIRASPTGY